MDNWNLKKVASKIKELGIAEAREIENLAGWIWEEVMGRSSQAELNLSASEEAKLLHSIHRLADGEPVQYIAGHAWFYGMKLMVTPDVLIPRPETEELVEWILQDIKVNPQRSLRILDVGTGSGCIAIALKKNIKNNVEVYALDVSTASLEVARKNAFSIGVEIKFVQLDFLREELTDFGLFDIIVSNPPYISKLNAREEIIKKLKFEPSLALYAEGDDPDIFYKRIASNAMKSLKPGGYCYLEINEFRSAQIETYFKKKGWLNVELKADMQGASRMLKVMSSG